MLRFADDLDVAALVEVHDVVELTRALDAGAQIVGVNSRNLRTLTVDPTEQTRIWSSTSRNTRLTPAFAQVNESRETGAGSGMRDQPTGSIGCGAPFDL